ncbi:hypothetical protein [Streptomyces sp. B6B3]|uniref:hypothetical protein n=1 Tax=Streptomyces sp. B6B3 TaxID=3153570 RepID=UPI00325C6413
MLPEALMALAAAGGAALVAAAATDAWATARSQFGRLLDREGGGRPELRARLDDLPGHLRSVRHLDATRAFWSAQFADLLERDPDAADELRAVLARLETPGPPPPSGAQTNIAHGGATQYITQSGTIHVTQPSSGTAGRDDDTG